MINIIEANTDELISNAKTLIQEYARSLEFDLDFQNFDRELDQFPGQYSPPQGCLYLAYDQNQPIGCVAIRNLEKGVCEMKRLYVKPIHRSKKAGRLLALAAIQAAKTMGYQRMRLDTLESMHSANRLYRSLGFNTIQPYRHNPLQGAIYMELDLKHKTTPTCSP